MSSIGRVFTVHVVGHRSVVVVWSSECVADWRPPVDPVNSGWPATGEPVCYKNTPSTTSMGQEEGVHTKSGVSGQIAELIPWFFLGISTVLFQISMSHIKRNWYALITCKNSFRISIPQNKIPWCFSMTGVQIQWFFSWFWTFFSKFHDFSRSGKWFCHFPVFHDG